MRDIIREQVWIGITDADRLFRYYGLLRDKLRRRDNFFTVVTILFAVLAIVPLTASASIERYVPDWLAVLFIILAIIATWWSSHAKYSYRAAVADAACDQYQTLASNWRRLWWANGTQEQVDMLNYQATQITAGQKLDEDQELNERAQRDSFKLLASEFGTS